MLSRLSLERREESLSFVLLTVEVVNALSEEGRRQGISGFLGDRVEYRGSIRDEEFS